MKLIVDLFVTYVVGESSSKSMGCEAKLFRRINQYFILRGFSIQKNGFDKEVKVQDSGISTHLFKKKICVS